MLGGLGADVAVAAADAPAVYAELLPAVRNRGRVLAFSHPGEPIQLDVADVQVRELEILGTCRCPHTFGALVEFILQGRLRPEELITAVLPLEELAEAFALARSQEKNLFRILIRLGEE